MLSHEFVVKNIIANNTMGTSILFVLLSTEFRNDFNFFCFYFASGEAYDLD